MMTLQIRQDPLRPPQAWGGHGDDGLYGLVATDPAFPIFETEG